MISAEQIRGARGILNWSQDTLAEQSGLSANTIYNLERGFSNRSAVTVRTTFEKKGIEFYGSTGVSIRKEQFVTYSGEYSADRFYEDVLNTIKEEKGNIVACYRSPDVMARTLGVTDNKKVDKLVKLSKYANVRCLFTEQRPSALAISQFKMRTTYPRLPQLMSTFTFGKKHATILSSDGKSFFYYIALAPEVAIAELNCFEELWINAKAIS